MAFLIDPNDAEYHPVTLEAHDLVFGDRQADYGHPLDDFDTTAAYWTTYLHSRGLLKEGVRVIGEDVSPMMHHVKTSRYANGINTGKPKRDTNTDMAGYAETGWRVIHERARRAAVGPLTLDLQPASPPGTTVNVLARVSPAQEGGVGGVTLGLCPGSPPPAAFTVPNSLDWPFDWPYPEDP